MKITKEGYDFDDLLLVPKISSINSRNDVDISVDFKYLKLKIPIIASPMKGIVSPELIIELDKLGGIGIMHRFYNGDKDWKHDLYQISKNAKNYGVSIGINNNNYKLALDRGAKIICIDVANGYLNSLRVFCNDVRAYISKNRYQCYVMSGNVVTREGADMLYMCGVDLIRVGIGSGGLCITRNVTGVGYPQLSAIMNCAGFWELPYVKEDSAPIEYSKSTTNYFIVADGGIRNSGDIVKSLAAGADLIMIGSLFGKAKEAANNGIIYGMASAKLQEEYHHGVKSIEGIEKTIKNDTTISDIINEIVWGIKSACTYLNSNNLLDLKKNVAFIETGKNSLKNYKI